MQQTRAHGARRWTRRLSARSAGQGRSAGFALLGPLQVATSPTSSIVNEASLEDILHTLHDSMADKVVSLLEKGGRELQARPRDRRACPATPALLAALAREAALRPGCRGRCRRARVSRPGERALLTRDEPRYRSPSISVRPSLRRLAAARLIPGSSPRAFRAPPQPGGRRAASRCSGWTRVPRRPRRSSLDPRTRERGRVALRPDATAIPWQATQRVPESAWRDQIGNRTVCLRGNHGLGP